MSFVYEKVDEKRFQELSGLIPKAWVLSMSMTQTIDRSRSLALVCLGGRGNLPRERGEPPMRYALLWKNLPILIESYERTRFASGKLEVNIDVVKINVPKDFLDSLMAIQGFIVEAFSCYLSIRLGMVANVAVQFLTTKIISR